MDFVHNYLKKFMWRSSKAHVSHELGLPPQEESLTWLIFSPVEAHFYRRQHERCAKKALEVMTENMGGMVDRKLTPNEVAKIMHPLLSLRQACCHPQVGSSGLRSLQKLPMTMDEVLKVLIDKAKIEGEEAQRNLIGSLNGLAALNILEGDLPDAVNLYREALFIVEENREIFDVDPLQKLHVLHNLQEVLCTQREPNNITDGDFLSRVQPMIGMDEPSSQKINALSSNDSVDSGGISKDSTSLSAGKNPSGKLDLCRTLRDSFLRQQCEEICTKYMASFYAKLSAAKQDYEDVHSEVLAHLRSLEDMNGATWWVDVLAIVSKESRKEKEMVNKIKSSLEDKEAYGLSNQVHINASSLASRFKDVNGLKYVLIRELDAIFECRNKFLVKISEFDEMMRSPTAENIQRAGNCSKCAQRGGPSCAICEADVTYKMYEKRLFKLRSNASSADEVSLENALPAQQRLLSQKHMNTLKNGVGTGGSSSQESSQQRTKDEGTDIAKIEVSRTPSETETILKLMKSFMKQNIDAGLLAASSKHLELLEAMRKEYSQARLLAVSQSMVLLALDELNMAKTRLCLRFPGEGEDSHTRSDPFKVHSEEIPQRNAQLTGEKFTALDDLRRAKGQVRYLQGLATIRERSKVIHKSISTQLNNGEALPRENTESLSTTGAGGGFMEEICPVCQDHLGKQMMVFPCGHLLCCKCLMPVADIETPSEVERKRIACPSCRHRTSMENIAFIDNGLGERSYSLSHNNKENCRSDEESFVSVNGSYGTKMEAVVRRILRVQAADPSSRFLVFSTWNDVLDVVGHSLSANNVGFLRAKGGRHLSTIIRKFKARDEAAKVLLLLIQQCSNGLNLTEAQHVILVEPLLNPGAEAQAVNRIHRIGQEKATYVHKFLIKDTVEESIHKLSQLKSQSQSQKFSAAGKMGNQEVAALTLKDLRVLFEDEAAYSSNRIPPIQSHVMNDNERTSRSLNLRDLPPSVAAAAAAEARLQRAQNARVPNEQ
ncbi:hypothetical protein KP509_23G027500 [Ceratopteris richardii]|nr:hypothetical protein KP509_23G027500 [Ceratopteris richardii]